jgi:hypothetical protein
MRYPEHNQEYLNECRDLLKERGDAALEKRRIAI